MANILCFEDPKNYDDHRLAETLHAIYKDPYGDVESLAGYAIAKELERRGFDILVAATSGNLTRIDKAGAEKG